MTNLARTDWTRALTAHPVPLLNALASQLTADCEVNLASLPQAGLGLLTLTDGAFHEPYYLGEFPLSACRVELCLADGRRADGGAQVLADDAGLARSLAILDAILAARFPGWDTVSAHVASGARLRSDEDHRRGAILAATRVDFALLNNASEDDDETL